jgi:CubicO group peptidase (beta-lactamase class C family)
MLVTYRFPPSFSFRPALVWCLLTGACLYGAPLAAQPTKSVTGAIPATQAARIRAVENSLGPYVPVAGLPGWNLLDRMRYHGVPGLSIAVIHNYRIDWVKGYGLADTTARTPVTPATLFSAGSISKLVAAGAALVQVQQGRLALDAPINDYLKSWKLTENDFTRQRTPTLRLLLSHRGGTSQSSYWGFVPSVKPLPTVLDILNGRPEAETRRVVVNGLPGSEFRYSGGGYLVVQQAMTDVGGGADFASLTEALLFRPLGMKSATYQQPLPAALAKRAAWAYSTNAWFKGVPYVYPQQAPAGLYATPTDLARFLIEVQNAYRGQGEVLKQASAQAMLAPQVDISTGTYREQMGVGAFLLQRADRPATDDASRYFEHTGVNAGFVAYALGSMKGGNGVVVMMNNDNGAAELGREVRRAVAQAYAWEAFLPPPVQPVRVMAAVLDAYAGRYQRSPEEVLTLKRVGDHLEETIAGTLGVSSPILCFPVGGDTLAFTDFVVRGVFRRDAAGQITGLQLPGNDRPFPRLTPDQLLPGELLRAGRLSEAVAGLEALQLNESQLTYLAYELINRRPQRAPDLAAAEAVLKLAEAQHPKASIVFARWGDLHLKRADTAQAIGAFRKAVALDPDDAASRQKLAALEGK